jgi:hypothetical protein
MQNLDLKERKKGNKHEMGTWGAVGGGKRKGQSKGERIQLKYTVCIYEMVLMKPIFKNLEEKQAEHRWLTPIILATWEAEIKRIVVHVQTRQKVIKTPSQPLAGHDSTPAIPAMMGNLN